MVQTVVRHVEASNTVYWPNLGISMSVFEEFSAFVEAKGSPALDVGCGLIAHAVLGEGREVPRLLDDLAGSLRSSDAVTMMQELFGSGRLAGDGVSYDDPANSFLHLVLSRQCGIPLTLSIIAIEVGRRLGIAIQPVGMPGHFLVGVPDDPTVYFDPFHGGLQLSATDCRALYERVTGLDTWDPAFLNPVNNRTVLIRLLTNLKSSYRRRDQLGELRSVMSLRAQFAELADREALEFARLMRSLN